MIIGLCKSFTNYGPNKRRSYNWAVSHLRITDFYAKQTAPWWQDSAPIRLVCYSRQEVFSERISTFRVSRDENFERFSFSQKILEKGKVGWFVFRSNGKEKKRKEKKRKRFSLISCVFFLASHFMIEISHEKSVIMFILYKEATN